MSTADSQNFDERLARALEQEKAKLKKEYEMKIEEAGKAKTDFLLNMSHDIRTPMNAIIGFTQMALKNSNDHYMVTNCLVKVKEASNFLMMLLNDVLDIAKIEQGKLSLEEGEVILAELLVSLENMVRESAVEKQVKLTFDCEDLQDDAVWGDQLHLTRIFMNIISNAIKYTRPGGEVKVYLKEIPAETPDTGLYVFSVQDNGIGMTEDFVKHIFEQFSRERNTTASGIQGTGLGMAITKNLVDMMKGNISVQSKLGIGTTVTVQLPLRLFRDEPRQRDDLLQMVEDGNVSLDGMHVLLVEDNLLNREIAMSMLSDLGVIVDEAEDGAIAVDKVRNSTPGFYHLVLMDIQMPYMNGYQATTAIRGLPDPSLASVPIYALSANAFPEDRKKSLDAGMDGHLSKPFKITEVVQALIKHAPDVSTKTDSEELRLPETKSENSIHTDKKKYTILITDDSEINRCFLQHILQDQYNVLKAENGQQALDILRSGTTPVHLILLDLAMPVMTGFEFMQIWRDTPELSSIPIMVETAGAVDEGELNSLRLGAEDFVKRPYQSEVILRRVANVLRHHYEMKEDNK